MRIVFCKHRVIKRLCSTCGSGYIEPKKDIRATINAVLRRDDLDYLTLLSEVIFALKHLEKSWEKDYEITAKGIDG